MAQLHRKFTDSQVKEMPDRCLKDPTSSRSWELGKPGFLP